MTSCCETPACNCQAPDGSTLPLGGVFKLDTNSSCATCTCVQGDNFNLYLQCFEPVCPNLSRCPKDRVRLADSQSCCPVCEDAVSFECTGENVGFQFQFVNPIESMESSKAKLFGWSLQHCLV